MAKSVEIALSTLDNKVLLSIQDDGIGFDNPEAPPWAIASRVAELGGHIIIESDDGPARLSIEMPIS